MDNVNSFDTNKKILIVSCWYPTKYTKGGSFVHTQAKILSQKYNVEVLNISGSRKIPRFTYKFYQEKKDGILINTVLYRFPLLNYLPLFFAGLIGYKKIIYNRFQPDLIHAHTRMAGFSSILLKLLYNIPLVITEHSGRFTIPNKDKPEHIPKVANSDLISTKIAYRFADYVIPVSKSLKKGLENIYNIKANYKIIYNVLEKFNKSKKEKIKNNDKVRILSVGSINRGKGSDVVYELVRDAINNNGYQIELLFIGNGKLLPELKSKALNDNLDKSIKFLGRIPHAKVMQNMLSADFLIHLSDFESFGLVLIEAISVGLPVFVSNTPSFKEIVNCNNGMIVSKKDYSKLKDKFLKMCNIYRNYNKKEISEDIIDKFGEKTFLNEIGKVYKKLCEKK